MMTWVSERSGMASSGMRRSDQTAPAIAATVNITMRNLFAAENSMSRPMAPAWRSTGRASSEDAGAGDPSVAGMLPALAAAAAHSLQRGLQPALRVDQEVAADHHRLALGQSLANLVIAFGRHAKEHVPRLE